jgi:hypothetical protein
MLTHFPLLSRTHSQAGDFVIQAVPDQVGHVFTKGRTFAAKVAVGKDRDSDAAQLALLG